MRNQVRSLEYRTFSQKKLESQISRILSRAHSPDTFHFFSWNIWIHSLKNDISWRTSPKIWRKRYALLNKILENPGFRFFGKRCGIRSLKCALKQHSQYSISFTSIVSPNYSIRGKWCTRCASLRLSSWRWRVDKNQRWAKLEYFQFRPIFEWFRDMSLIIINLFCFLICCSM